MKYNPKVNEEMARLPGFAGAHPYQPEEVSQGALQLIHELEQYLNEVSGMDRVTLQPSAGAQGELTGMLMIRAYLADRGIPRKKVLVPDTAHGTNPASSSLCGYQVVQVKSDERGRLSPRAIEEKMDEDVAALMVTNPNTLGLFEDHICEVAQIVHHKGGLIYCDGANLNALMGLTRVGDMGVDVLHFNLHKTFSTPHGGTFPLPFRERLPCGCASCHLSGIGPTVKGLKMKTIVTLAVVLISASTSVALAQVIRGDSKAGQHVYEQQCLRCHGVTLDGNGSDSKDLVIPPANFQSKKSRSKTDWELLVAISNGVLFSPMHGFRGKLTDQQMLDVLSYIRSVAQPDITS